MPRTWANLIGGDKWDSLPTEVRDAVAKREKEVSDGFKQYGEKAQDLQKYETLIGQYRDWETTCYNAIISFFF